MKNFKKFLGIMTVIAVIAVAFAPQAQARKKRDLKKEAIEDLLREGNAAYEAENYDDAFDYFEAAHKKGNIRATHNLAICYAQGYGVDKSLTMALKLHEKAAKKGNVDSMVELGMMYKNAYGVKQDYKKAINPKDEKEKENAKNMLKNALEKAKGCREINDAFSHWVNPEGLIEIIEQTLQKQEQ